jgi:hypothetical protein
MDEPAEARQECIGDFPKELLDYIKGGTRVVVVKGRPRTGKTLFVLGLVEAVSQPHNTFIVSTRALDPSVYENFPWLKNNESRDKALEILSEVAAPVPKKTQPPPKPPEQDARIKSAREMLMGILGEVPEAPPAEEQAPAQPQAPGESELAGIRQAIGDKNPKELVRIYRGLAKVPPGTANVVVVLDRADRLCEKLGIRLDGFVPALASDLAKRHRAHLFIVLEKPVPDLDAMAGGIVAFKEVGQSDDFLGQLEMVRLGDMKLKSPKWMYNLRGGRFQVLRGMRVWG